MRAVSCLTMAPTELNASCVAGTLSTLHYKKSKDYHSMVTDQTQEMGRRKASEITTNKTSFDKWRESKLQFLIIRVYIPNSFDVLSYFDYHFFSTKHFRSLNRVFTSFGGIAILDILLSWCHAEYIPKFICIFSCRKYSNNYVSPICGHSWKVGEHLKQRRGSEFGI